MAAVLNQMPVPDMADSIWAAISAQLDVVEEPGDGTNENPEVEGIEKEGEGNDPEIPATPGETDLTKDSNGSVTADNTKTDLPAAPDKNESACNSKIVRIFGKISTGGWISIASAAAAAVASTVMYNVNIRPVTPLPKAPAGPVHQKTVIAPTPDSMIISPDIIFTLPPIQMPVQFDPPPPQPDSISIAPMKIDSAELLQVPGVPDQPASPVTEPSVPPMPTTPASTTKKVKGIKGITEDDYRIGVKKDSTAANH
ncbi:hypothetical protein SAMN05444266_104383 [Chitinophaga jiangningensis]|uniref:Uncharacterized protein n=1 Tax=Chitinophaga jiangningensis TaxID=1419482 RepID=A0A1M7CLS5_9BACT|nr:hypothetical protein [Chitinophaga jiangningensis]SHL68157.1 hypothetical protein SAMN05444266_104383 [Chitinophaga jiangningensis]